MDTHNAFVRLFSAVNCWKWINQMAMLDIISVSRNIWNIFVDIA